MAVESNKYDLRRHGQRKVIVISVYDDLMFIGRCLATGDFMSRGRSGLHLLS
jgi:hypothetical protein